MGFLNSIINFLTSTTSSKSNEISRCSQQIDYTTIQGIEAINKDTAGLSNSDSVQSIAYTLQRKATQYKANGHMDLAIACLRKSNELMPYSSGYFSEKDYMRLPKYLKLDGQVEEAEKAEKEIKMLCKELRRKVSLERIEQLLENARNLKTDLILVHVPKSACPICKQFENKVLSLTGRDTRYPKAPDILFKEGGFHEDCKCNFTAYFEGITTIHTPKVSKIPPKTSKTSIPAKRDTMSEIYRRADVINQTINLINTTTNPDVFFERYELMINLLNELIKMKAKIMFSNLSPQQTLKTYTSKRSEYTMQFIKRSYLKTLKSAEQLKTEKGKANRINKFFIVLSTYDKYLSEENRIFVQELRTNKTF